MCCYDKEQWHIICRKFLGLDYRIVLVNIPEDVPSFLKSFKF